MDKTKTPIWKKKKPKGRKSFKLTPQMKEEAKERAAKAGRPYPNLIDNIWVTKKYKPQIN